MVLLSFLWNWQSLLKFTILQIAGQMFIKWNIMVIIMGETPGPSGCRVCDWLICQRKHVLSNKKAGSVTRLTLSPTYVRQSFIDTPENVQVHLYKSKCPLINSIEFDFALHSKVIRKQISYIQRMIEIFFLIKIFRELTQLQSHYAYII